MRAITFKYGSRENGWKYYTCTEQETKWDKERASLWGLEGNMTHWTYPKEDINIGRKNQIELDEIPMEMDYAKCNYNKLHKKLNSIVKDMKEENFDVNPETTNYYWELTISDYEVSDCIGCVGVRHNKYFKMWRGANHDPQGLQEIKDCFSNYYKNKYLY